MKVALQRLVSVLLVTAILVIPVGAKEMELRFWHGFGGGNDQQKLVELAERFQASHPEIKVVPEVMVAGPVDKLIAALAAGVPPDIFWQTGSLILQTGNFLVPLDKYIDAEPGFREDHFPGLWQDAQWEGVTYGIPFEHASIGLGFNTELFQQVGLDLKGPQNWDELQWAARKLTDTQRNLFGINLTLNDVSWATQVITGSLLVTNGGTFMTPDERTPLITSDEMVETFEFVHELVQVNRVSTPSTPWITSRTVGMGLALQGRIMQGVAPGAPTEGLIGTAMVPAQVQRGSINTSKNIFIIKSDAEREDAAWEFVKWLVSPEINFEWHVMQMQYLPTRKAVVRMPLFQRWLKENPLVMPWLQQADYVVSRPRSPEWAITNTQLQGAFKKSVIDGTMAPRAALEEADRIAKAAIAELE